MMDPAIKQLSSDFVQDIQHGFQGRDNAPSLLLSEESKNKRNVFILWRLQGSSQEPASQEATPTTLSEWHGRQIHSRLLSVLSESHMRHAWTALYQSQMESVTRSMEQPPWTIHNRLTGPIKFVRRLLKIWKLEPQDAVPLLGLEQSEQPYVEDMLGGYGHELPASRDVKDRIAYLFQIRSTLANLFRDEEEENDWLREHHSMLDGQSPLTLLRQGTMENLLIVRDYVLTVAGK